MKRVAATAAFAMLSHVCQMESGVWIGIISASNGAGLGMHSGISVRRIICIHIHIMM